MGRGTITVFVLYVGTKRFPIYPCPTFVFNVQNKYQKNISYPPFGRVLTTSRPIPKENPKGGEKRYALFSNTIAIAWIERNFIHTVLVDYTKIIDVKNPIILLDKLNKINDPHFALQWIADFLNDRSQRVKVGGALFDKLEVWSIVHKGTKLCVSSVCS